MVVLVDVIILVVEALPFAIEVIEDSEEAIVAGVVVITCAVVLGLLNPGEETDDSSGMLILVDVIVVVFEVLLVALEVIEGILDAIVEGVLGLVALFVVIEPVTIFEEETSVLVGTVVGVVIDDVLVDVVDVVVVEVDVVLVLVVVVVVVVVVVDIIGIGASILQTNFFKSSGFSHISVLFNVRISALITAALNFLSLKQYEQILVFCVRSSFVSQKNLDLTNSHFLKRLKCFVIVNIVLNF